MHRPKQQDRQTDVPVFHRSRGGQSTRKTLDEIQPHRRPAEITHGDRYRQQRRQTHAQQQASHPLIFPIRQADEYAKERNDHYVGLEHDADAQRQTREHLPRQRDEEQEARQKQQLNLIEVGDPHVGEQRLEARGEERDRG